MEHKLMFALMILSWIGLVWGVFIAGLGIYAEAKYPGSLEQQLDQIRGVTVEWQTSRYVMLAIISAVILITYYFG